MLPDLEHYIVLPALSAICEETLNQLVASLLYTNMDIALALLSGPCFVNVCHQLSVIPGSPCSRIIRQSEVAAAQPSRPVKASLGLLLLVQPVFFRVGLEIAEGNMGQNSLLTSISCCWGAQGSCGGVKGRVALLI